MALQRYKKGKSSPKPGAAHGTQTHPGVLSSSEGQDVGMGTQRQQLPLLPGGKWHPEGSGSQLCTSTSPWLTALSPSRAKYPRGGTNPVTVLAVGLDIPAVLQHCTSTTPKRPGGFFLCAVFRNCNVLVLSAAAKKSCAAFPVPLPQITTFYFLGPAQQIAQEMSFSILFPLSLSLFFSFFFPLLLVGHVFSPSDRKLHLQISTPGGEQI